DVSDLRLKWLTHIYKYEIVLVVALAMQFHGTDLDPDPRPPSPVPASAERLVIDQRRHSRMLAAHRAIGILLQRQLAELHAPAVEQHEAADQRLSKSDDPLDRFQRLQRADDSRQDAEHAALGARRHEVGRRRLRVEAPVARSLLRVEHRDLAVEPENRAIDVGLTEQHARVIHEIASGEIIGAVDDDVEPPEDLEGVAGREPLAKRFDLYVRIDVPQALARRVDLRRPDRGGPVDDLTLQVAAI